MYFQACLVALIIKNPTAMQKTGLFPGLDDPLVKGMTIHFSILACRIHEQRNLAGQWGHKESDTSEQLST